MPLNFDVLACLWTFTLDPWFFTHLFLRIAQLPQKFYNWGHRFYSSYCAVNNDIDILLDLDLDLYSCFMNDDHIQQPKEHFSHVKQRIQFLCPNTKFDQINLKIAIHIHICSQIGFFYNFKVTSRNIMFLICSKLHTKIKFFYKKKISPIFFF